MNESKNDILEPDYDDSLGDAADAVLMEALDGLIDDEPPASGPAPDPNEDPYGTLGAAGDGKPLDQGREPSQDADEQPGDPAADEAYSKALQAVQRTTGLDPAALEGSLSREAIFEAGRHAQKVFADQQRDYERLRAGSGEAGTTEGTGDTAAAPTADDPGRTQEDSTEGQPAALPELDEVLQPLAEIDAEASEVLKSALQPLYDSLPKLQAAELRSQQAEARVVTMEVANVRRELQKADLPQLAQPDVWNEVDARAQQLIASGAAKYREPSTVAGRIELALRDAAAQVAPSSDPLAGGTTASTPGGSDQGTEESLDELDTMIMGLLD